MEYIDKLVQIRKSRGKTQADIASVLNTSTQYYQKYEKGKHPLPIDHLITLCKYYGVSADYMLGLTDNVVPMCNKCHKEIARTADFVKSKGLLEEEQMLKQLQQLRDSLK